MQRRALGRARLGLALLVVGVVGGALATRPARVLAAGKSTPALRAIAAAFVRDGDVARAKKALAAEGATVDDLLATLREAPVPHDAPVAGERTLELTDGNGTKTDLVVVAPSAEALAARGAKPLGLAVLLHGLGGNARNMVPLGRLLAATGDVVAVCPSAQKVPEGQGGEDGVPADGLLPHWWLYESAHSFPLEAIRRAKELYRIDPERVVLSGHSMGGFGSYNISLRHSDLFAGAAPLAGGISRLPYSLDYDARTRALLGNGLSVPFFVVHGDADRTVRYDVDAAIVAKLKSLGAKVDWRPLEGEGHMLSGIWRGATDTGHDLVQFLTTQKRVASPERVRYACWGDKLEGAFWLRIAERTAAERRPDVLSLEGSVDRARNSVTVRATGVARVRVYFDERLLDLSKTVRVEVSGAARFEGKVQPTVEAVLESWRSREDPGLVYPAFVDVDPREFQ